jgi:uncharacterized membrane protein
MFGATMILMLILFAVLILLRSRAARRARSETPAQRARRLHNEKETATVLSIVEDDGRRRR